MQKLYTDSKMRLLLENGEGKKKWKEKLSQTQTQKEERFFFLSVAGT